VGFQGREHPGQKVKKEGDQAGGALKAAGPGDPCPLVGYFKDPEKQCRHHRHQDDRAEKPVADHHVNMIGHVPPCLRREGHARLDHAGSDSVAVFGHDRGGVGIKMTLHAGRRLVGQGKQRGQVFLRSGVRPGQGGFILFKQLRGHPARRILPRQVRMSADGLHKRENFFIHGMAVSDGRGHGGYFPLNDRNAHLPQLGDAPAAAGHRRNDGNAKQRGHLRRVHLVSAPFRRVHHVQRDDHGNAHFHELGGEIQVALEI